jgi:hypothetical protein
MSQRMSRVVPSLCAGCLLLAQAAFANAQGWYPTGNGCPSCSGGCGTGCATGGCATSCCAPVTCMQPVSVPCYQTVPITTYEPERRTVMKPVVQTELIEQPITECRPVCETRTAQIPTCTYQPVTEFVPQTRDCGRMVTYCQCCPRMSPCQYDPNPGLLGWMNRTGYEMRMAFTPRVVYRSQWVPNYITTMVPVTRQVAQHSVQTVTYNVTRMETIRTSHRVPVCKVVMVPEEITVHRPVTVFRTIPIGTSVAWVPAGSVTATAGLPGGLTPDRVGARRELRAAERVGERIGEQKGIQEGKHYERDKIERREGDLLNQASPTDPDGHRSEIVIPQRRQSDGTGPQQVSQRIPSAAVVNGWMARREASPEGHEASASVAIADAQK